MSVFSTIAPELSRDVIRELYHASGMDDDIPVVVRMRVECARCGHAEANTYEFELPRDDSEPMEEYVPGICPDCGAPILDAPDADAAAAVNRTIIRTGRDHRAADDPSALPARTGKGQATQLAKRPDRVPYSMRELQVAIPKALESRREA